MITLTTLFLEQLADQYDAERKRILAMPPMIAAATCSRLQKELLAQLKESTRPVRTLEKVFGSFDEWARAKQSEATIVLLEKGDEITMSSQGTGAIDPALISGAQRIERCEINSYGSPRAQAALLENREAAALLNAILAEEEVANQALGELNLSPRHGQGRSKVRSRQAACPCSHRSTGKSPALHTSPQLPTLGCQSQLRLAEQFLRPSCDGHTANQKPATTTDIAANKGLQHP